MLSEIPERLQDLHEIFNELECPKEDCIHYHKEKPRCRRCDLHYENLTIVLPNHPIRDYCYLLCEDYEEKKVGSIIEMLSKTKRFVIGEQITDGANL